jgi:hypothetical protein
MGWSILRKLASSALAGIFLPLAAFCCPLCFGSSSPRVLHAYYLNAVIMIGLAWLMGIGICAFAFGRHQQTEERVQANINEKPILFTRKNPVFLTKARWFTIGLLNRDAGWANSE